MQCSERQAQDKRFLEHGIHPFMVIAIHCKNQWSVATVLYIMDSMYIIAKNITIVMYIFPLFLFLGKLTIYYSYLATPLHKFPDYPVGISLSQVEYIYRERTN